MIVPFEIDDSPAVMPDPLDHYLSVFGYGNAWLGQVRRQLSKESYDIELCSIEAPLRVRIICYCAPRRRENLCESPQMFVMSGQVHVHHGDMRRTPWIDTRDRLG